MTQHTEVGVITIGQTPRVDMIPAIRPFFHTDTVFIEKGVLDHKKKSEIERLAPEAGQTVLVSRLHDGNKAVIAKEKILSIIQQLINELNQLQVDIILLACTGKFPEFTSQVTVVYPDFLLNHVVKGLFREGEIGVIIPLPEQKREIITKWADASLIAIPRFSSPYDFLESALIEATTSLEQLPIKTIILDCMGYTEEMKNIVQQHTTKTVILSRNIVYQNIAELF